MIEVIRGASEKPVSTEKLISFLLDLRIEGVLYTGYPLLPSVETYTALDALLVSPNYGIVLFDIIEEPTFSERQEVRDQLYNYLLQKLIGHKELTEKRGRLKVEINVLTFAPAWQEGKGNKEVEVIKDNEDLRHYLQSNIQNNLSLEDYRRVIEVIQSITKLKNKTPRRINRIDSKGSILNDIEKSIANLDRQQSKAVIETVNGIQRIRGLAGSGKTIVLALKVAYLHSKFPDWTIGVTFYTRSLKNQFEDLITKFTIEQKSEEPDWNKIKIQQAWGSSRDSGFYYEFCLVNNVEYYDYDTAKGKYGTNAKLIDILSSNALKETKTQHQIYDAILIDEAQDFSESFLKLCYSLLKPASLNNKYDKRLIYAYDELQKLDDLDKLRHPTEIFPGIEFETQKNAPRQDIILAKCYRNSAPLLVTAHALGFGIYHNDGKLVTMFGDKELWTDVGYVVDDGVLEFGQRVVLKRDLNSSPDFLTNKVSTDDLVHFNVFRSTEEQYLSVANEIECNLKNDDLSFRDIIVIHPNALKAKNELSRLREILFDKGIQSHLAGVSTSPDVFFLDNSISFTSIYRAKGNEAAMIYIVDAEYCYQGAELIKKRNILFTAMTRSKGWVRVNGIGESMQYLIEEFNRVKKEGFRLNFKYPTPDEMKKLNLLHRDLSEVEKKDITESEKSLTVLLKNLKDGKILPSDLPKNNYEELKRWFLENEDS